MSDYKNAFLDKKFFLHFRRVPGMKTERYSELIKLFGGQIDQFLDRNVNYVLTDVPRGEWPPDGQDRVLTIARRMGIKLMALEELIYWCSKYVNNPLSSSDDDDDHGAKIRPIQNPFIKLEDYNCCFAPQIREFKSWPRVNLTNIQPGKSIFCDTTSALNTPQTSVTNHQQPIVINMNHSAQFTPNTSAAQKVTRRKHSTFCEVCNVRLTEKIEEHIDSPLHLEAISKIDWTEVNQVIDCLPSLSTLNRHRLSDLSIPKGVEYQEFVCLHKMDSVSQLFQTLVDK